MDQVSGKARDLIRAHRDAPLAAHMSRILAALGPDHTLDDWVGEKLRDYVPEAFPALQLDVVGTEQKVFSLFDRLIARRNELLQLQGQVLLRLLQYDFQVNGRRRAKTIIDASTRVEEASTNTAGMRRAATAFDGSNDPVPQGLKEQSLVTASVEELSQSKERIRREEMKQQVDDQASYDDSVNALYEWKRGPLDYSGRYERLQSLYLNDYRSFVDATVNYREGVKLLGIDPAWEPDFRSPTFIWDAGEKIQILSRALYTKRMERSVRHIALTIGWTESGLGNRGVYPFLKASTPSGATQPLSWFEFKELMTPSPNGPPPPPYIDPNLPDPTGMPKQWVRLRFAVAKDLAFDNAGTHFHSATGFRIEAVGVQWIVTSAFKEVPGSDSPTDADADRVTAQRMRNHRGIAVPTTLRTPPGENRLAAAEAHFPLACTTDDGIEKVVANTDPLIVGRSPFGEWEVDIGMPLRNGGKQPRLKNDANASPDSHPWYPNIIGLILHLAVSAKFES